MKISRKSVGLAVRAVREAAGLTLTDLAGMTDINISLLSRTERGERDLSFTEADAIARAVQIDFSTFHDYAETFELSGIGPEVSDLERDVVQLQRLAIEAAVEARSRSR